MSEEEEQKHSQLQAQQISQAEIWELLQEKSIIFFLQKCSCLKFAKYRNDFASVSSSSDFEKQSSIFLQELEAYIIPIP